MGTCCKAGDAVSGQFPSISCLASWSCRMYLYLPDRTGFSPHKSHTESSSRVLQYGCQLSVGHEYFHDDRVSLDLRPTADGYSLISGTSLRFVFVFIVSYRSPVLVLLDIGRSVVVRGTPAIVVGFRPPPPKINHPCQKKIHHTHIY